MLRRRWRRLSSPGSSRPTTSAGSTASRSTATPPRRSAAAFARVLAKLAGKPASELRIGLGRDMRLSAPELAARYRDGLVAEGAHVLDAGMVGTEMLYWLVGSRELDGGLMCTASHNPKAYTGAKLVERGASRCPATRGLQDIRALVEDGLGEAPRRRHRPRRSTSTPTSRRARWRSSTRRDPPAEGRARRRQRHGRADGRADPRAARRSSSSPPTGSPTASSPTTSPTRCCRRTASSSSPRCARPGADLGIAWDGDADRCFFIDDDGEFVAGDFLTALLAESVLSSTPGADILYDVRASRAVPDTVERLGGRALVNRVGHAFFKTRMRDEGGEFGGEVSGHYYFKAFYNADSGTIPALLMLELLSKREHDAERAARATSRHLLHLRRDQLRGRRPGGARSPRSRARYARRARSRELDGISVDYEDWHFNVRPSNTEPLLRLNLESLVSQDDMERRRDEVLELIRSMIHSLPIPTPFAVGRVNCYLIEDDPLTLVDTGPNSGKALDELERGAARRTGAASRTSSGSSSPTSTSTTSGWSAILAGRSGAEVVRARPARAGDRGLRRRTRRPRRARRGADAAPRHPARRGHRAARGLARVPRLGRHRAGHARCCTTAASSASPAAR